MALGRRLLTLALGLALFVAGCSSSSSSGGATIAVTSVTQDLTGDPSGLTIVVGFSAPPGALTTANFSADGGQTAQTVNVVGSNATVTWDQRVTPAHTVTVVAPNVFSVPAAVGTSDATVPGFTATAVQNAGLGGDVITVTFAGGPNIVEAVAEDPSNWQLDVAGNTLPLTASTLDFVPGTQVLTITTDATVNVHATFALTPVNVTTVSDVALAANPVAGTGCCDVAAPNLVTSDQNLAADALGRVVDFTFDEAVDPASLDLADFTHATAIATNLTTPMPNVVQVTFSEPIVPGKPGNLDDVTIDDVLDVHGNEVTGAPLVATVTSTGAVGAAYDAATAAVTVPNVLGDHIDVVTTQALDPDDAVDPTKWTITVNAAPLTMADQTLTYDLASATLTVELDADLQNGDTVVITAGNVLEIDGDLFAAASGGIAAAGDAGLPTITGVEQNRSLDSTGQTLDVSFSEDVDTATAQNAGNWTISGGVNVDSATLLGNSDTVRLALDAPATPGVNTIDVSTVEDIAGNVLAPVVGMAVTSDDTTPASLTSASAMAISGANNDTVAVRFDDDMYASDVTNVANWAVESPVGTMIDPMNATAVYDAPTRTATLTFDGGDDVNFKRDQDFEVTLSNVRDIAGNAMGAGTLSGPVAFEAVAPVVDSAWVVPTTGTVTVRFSEACDHLDDIGFLTSYVVFDVATPGSPKPDPTSAVPTPDGLGVTLTYPFAIDTANDRLRVHGVTDLAGNPLFPVDLTIAAEDTNAVALDMATAAVSISGEHNDEIQVRFTTPPGSPGRLDPAHYTLVEQGVGPVDISSARFVWDPVTPMVRIVLDESVDHALTNGQSYDLTIDGLTSAQGIAMGGPDMVTTVAGGDAVQANLVAGRVRVDAANSADSILVELDEAYDPADLATLSNVQLNAANATALTAVGPRTLRATFGVMPVATDTIDVTLDDLAGNAMAMTATEALQAEVATGPFLFSVGATATSGAGGDTVSVTWSTPVETTTGTSLLNYTLESPPGTPIDLTGATRRYVSATNTVEITLPGSVNLTTGAGFNVSVSSVANPDGLVMSPGMLGGTVGGDATAPAIDKAFVDYRDDIVGFVVAVQFDEPVDSAFALDPANWSGSGGQSGFAVTQLNASSYRVELLLPLNGGETLDLAAGLTDLAGNAAGALSVTPVQ